MQMPRLRVINDDGRNYLASTDARYDVIIGEPSNPWLTGVSDLFTADHFRIAKRKLRAGGVYCEWVQLYEMSPENVKIIYRTFASQFRYVVVFSAEDLSSDTVLVGSDSPLPLDLASLRAGFAAPGVASELERAYVHSPFDVLARVLLSSRQEVMAYTQIETRYNGRAFEPVPSSTNAGPCSLPHCFRTPSPINTDDNALIEFAAPRDLIGFERYKGYLQTIYSDTWPYGGLSELVSGFRQAPARRAEDHAELALALLAHGRRREASHMLDQAAAYATVPTLTFARAMFDALDTSGPAPAPVLRPPLHYPGIGDQLNRILVNGALAAMDALSAGDPKQAKARIESISSSLWDYGGAELHYLRAYTLYRNGDYDLAIGDLEGLARGEPTFVLEHPELYLFLARSHGALQHFDKAVRSARVYVEAQLRRARAPRDEGERSTQAAPETDADRESDKAFRTRTSESSLFRRCNRSKSCLYTGAPTP